MILFNKHRRLWNCCYKSVKRLFGVIILGVFISISLLSCKTVGSIGNNPGKDSLTADRNFYKTYSLKLGITLCGKEDKKLIREVTVWIGTPYKYGGADRSGTDCSGFTMSVYKTVYNMSLYRSAADQIKNTDKVEKVNLRCGDLIFFKIKKDKVSHVGLYIADNKFVHASSKRGVVVNDLSEEYYSKYFFSAGRVKGITSR